MPLAPSGAAGRVARALRLAYRDRAAKLAAAATALLYAALYVSVTRSLALVDVQVGKPLLVKLLNPPGVGPEVVAVVGGRAALVITPVNAFVLGAVTPLLAANAALLVYLSRRGARGLGVKLGGAAAASAITASLACGSGCLSASSAVLASIAPAVAGAGAAAALASFIARWEWALVLASAALLSWSLARVSRIAVPPARGGLRLGVAKRGSVA